MKKSWNLVVLGIGAALLMLLGGLTSAWWSYIDGNLHTYIGLRDAQLCKQELCTAVALDRISTKQDAGWVRAGIGAYAGAWIAAILAMALAGGAVAGWRPRLLGATTFVAGFSAAAAGAVFVLWAPTYVAKELGVSVGCYFGGAALTAILGVLALVRPGRD